MTSNGDCFDDFVRAESVPLVKFLAHVGFGWEEAEDAAAEAMLTACQKWSTLRNPRAYVRTAAVHTATNQAIRDRQRTERSIRGGWATPEHSDPFAEIDERLDAEPRLLALLKLLPPKQRLVLAWHIDGFSNTEIADILQMPVATVASHLRHARQRLRTQMPLPKPRSAAAVEGGGHNL